MGFATDRDGWLRLLQCLLASSASAGLQICTFDNRGAPPCTWWSCVRVTCCSLVCAQVSVCRASPRSASRRPTWRAFVPCTPTSTLFSLVALVSLTLSLPCFSLISSASGCVLSHCFVSLSSSARCRPCSVAVFLVLCRCHCCPRCRRLACPALLLTHCRCLLRTPSISQSTLAGRTSILLGAHAHCLCASDYSDRDLSLGDCLGLLPMRSPFSMTARSLCSHAAEYSVQHLHGRNDLPGDCARCSAWVHSVAHAGASMGALCSVSMASDAESAASVPLSRALRPDVYIRLVLSVLVQLATTAGGPYGFFPGVAQVVGGCRLLSELRQPVLEDRVRGQISALYSDEWLSRAVRFCRRWPSREALLSGASVWRCG